MTCPLCDSRSTRTVQSIPVEDIRSIYKRFLDVEVAPCFYTTSLDYMECEECELLYFSPTTPGDESFYNELQQYEWYYADEKEEFLAASTWIHSSDRVLEIGCGKGAFSRHINCAAYEGIDLSENAVCMAGEAGLDVYCTTVEAHAEGRCGIYDVVCAFQTLEHVVAPGEFLRAAVSCLAPGGRLLLSVPSQSSFVGETCNAVLNLPPHHLSRWTDATLRAIGKLHGLNVLALDHMPLDESHAEWFAMTAILRHLRKLPGLNPMAAVDNSFFYWKLYALARFLAKRGVAKPDMNLPPDGHTVLAVFEKAGG